MEDDNIIPYETSPTLTIQQAVVRMLAYPGPKGPKDYMDRIDFGDDLYAYLYDQQELADHDFNNAKFALYELEQDDTATSDAINAAKEQIESTKAQLERAQNLLQKAEYYRLLINHEITRIRSGKRSPLIIDEDESKRIGEVLITVSSFHEWLEGMELADDNGTPVLTALPVDEDAFAKALTAKSAESLYVTLGLLISLFAETGGGKFGTAQQPKVINIAKKLDDYANELNDKQPLHGQQTQAIRKRIELAVSALKSYI